MTSNYTSQPTSTLRPSTTPRSSAAKTEAVTALTSTAAARITTAVDSNRTHTGSVSQNITQMTPASVTAPAHNSSVTSVSSSVTRTYQSCPRPPCLRSVAVPCRVPVIHAPAKRECGRGCPVAHAGGIRAAGPSPVDEAFPTSPGRMTTWGDTHILTGNGHYVTLCPAWASGSLDTEQKQVAAAPGSPAPPRFPGFQLSPAVRPSRSSRGKPCGQPALFMKMPGKP